MFKKLADYFSSWFDPERDPKVAEIRGRLDLLDRIANNGRKLIEENADLRQRVAIKEAEAAAMAGLVMQREAHIRALEERIDAGQD